MDPGVTHESRPDGEALRVAEVLIIVGWGLNAPPSTGEDLGMLMSESLHLD